MMRLRCTLILSCIILIVSSYLAQPVHVAATVPYPITMILSYSYTPLETKMLQMAHVQLTTFSIPLNAFEVELLFDPVKTQVSEVQLHEALCEPRFIIEKMIDNTAGVVRVSCGSTTPFISGETPEAVVSVVAEQQQDMPIQFTIGSSTRFYVHDGLGTVAATKIGEASSL